MRCVWLSKIDKNILLWIGRLLVYAMVFVALLPYLDTGYVGDDIRDSLMRGYCINLNLNIIQGLLVRLKIMVGQGRTDFVSWTVAYLIFYITGTCREIYKLVIIMITMSSLYSAERFVGYYFKSKYIGAMYLLLCAAFFPIYMRGSNSVAMYWGFMQLEVVLFFEMLYFLEKYIDNRRRRDLLISGAIFILSLFMYEISYLYILAIVVIIFSRNRTDARKIAKPYMVLWGSALLLNLICKIGSSIINPAMSYDGTSIGTGIKEMVQAFLIQMLGAMPLYSFVAETVLSGGTGLCFNPGILVGVGILILCEMLLFKVCGHTVDSNKNEKEIKECVLFGSILWMGVAAMIAVTVKYQRELPVSWAPHIPVYVEYFMLMLLVLVTYLWIEKKRMQLWVRCCIMLIVVALGGYNYCVNEALVSQYVNETSLLYVDMPEMYQTACGNGLLDVIGTEDEVIIDIAYSPTIYPELLAQASGKAVMAERLDLFVTELVEKGCADGKYCPEGNLYITKSFCSQEQTVIYLEKVNTIELEGEKIKAIEISNVWVYCISEYQPQCLTVIKDDIVDVIQYTQCRVQSKGDNQYLIELPAGVYDYYSYTYWN